MFDSTKKQLDFDTLTEYHRQLVSIINTSNNGNQVDTMPTASAVYNGKIVQYIGTTDTNYTKGYFYECVNNSGTYSWVQTDVQEGSSGGRFDYSTDEKVVGTWIDGRPIWQKVITGLSLSLSQNWTTVPGIDATNINNIIYTTTIGATVGDGFIPVKAYISGSAFNIALFSGGGTAKSVIIQYTKTTD